MPYISGFSISEEGLPVHEFMLKEPVELSLPAQQNMMLVLRLTTAGVIARAGLTVDKMDDVKMAVEEACSCLIGAENGPRRLDVRFVQEESFLKISICGDCECGGPVVCEDERTVVSCILESLVDDVKICMREGAVGAIEMRVALNM